MVSIKLGGRLIGPGEPPYVIAEIGSNHNGDMELCKRLIDAAADAGADAVKFQSWTEKTLIADEEYARNTEYSDKKKHFGSLRDMVRAYQLTVEQHEIANAHCQKRGIAFSSTPFAKEEVDHLVKLNVPFFKIASMDVTHLELLKHVARQGKPVILSTGMATLGEIEQAVTTLRGSGCAEVILLHCVSLYPPDYNIIHLRNMATLAGAFNLPVGFSDHTQGVAIPLAAVALGARVIEKHFTLDKDMEGWDHAISADPTELRAIVQEGRNVVTSLGSFERQVSPAEIEKRKKFRRSLVLRAAVKSGHVIREEDLDAKRPGTGIAPEQMRFVVGRSVTSDLPADQVLRWENLR